MLLAALLFVATFTAEPVCTIGSGTSSWSGSPADLAQIEARYQAERAQEAGRPFPDGAPVPSPWTGLVRCTTRVP